MSRDGVADALVVEDGPLAFKYHGVRRYSSAFGYAGLQP
jgi:hypothetical protein